MADDLDTLFRQYRSELHGMAYRRLRDREAAADVVQDAFVRYVTVARTPERATSVESPRFFLWRVVGNLVIDFLRRHRRRGEHGSLDDMADRLADTRPLPDRTIETRQLLAILCAALNDLPPKCRAALLLNRIEGLSHAEVAERLGVSVSMVSKYIMQALRHCLRRLSRTAGSRCR